VQELLSRKFALQISVWTVGRYLRAWGLTPQKPVRRAYEQNPTAVRKWLEEEYPSIRAQVRKFKAQIHWLDEMGLRSDHQAGRSYGTARADASGVWHRSALSLQHDLFHYQSGAAGLHNFPTAFYGAGVSEFSWPSPAPDAEDQEEGVSDCGWSPSPQGAIRDTLAGRAP